MIVSAISWNCQELDVELFYQDGLGVEDERQVRACDRSAVYECEA